MKNHTDSEEELRAALKRGSVIVVGTGVSIAATIDSATNKPHPQASWQGLLENGLDWLETHSLIKTNHLMAHRALLTEGAETHHYISAAQDVMKLMGGAGSKHFADWLKETVGSMHAHEKSTLRALEELRKYGNLLATTNYDGLLLGDSQALMPVTWKSRDAFLKAARNKDVSQVMFLHGYWRQPESVILDWSSYDMIARDEGYRQELETVWQMTTWVYVGCGINGISDPDFSLLLERYGSRARGADLWDYCLVRQSSREEFQARFDNLRVNIRAISFGENHEDLSQYLRTFVLPKIDVSGLPFPREEQYVADGLPIPRPPEFYAEPAYMASHNFVGRTTQLEEITTWAKATDPANLLLFEAIGGNGKSMLTWEWARKHAMHARGDWAGIFWYSFYEKGAVMADFCQRALAYITGKPLKSFSKMKTPELAKNLLAHLHARPWLLILDGLERVLVAYHRIDAAEIPDEEADQPSDKIAERNPCDTTRDEDGDLLRSLATATPSKSLVSSRLIPRVLLNVAGIPIPGVRPIVLPGLDQADAEAMLRSCGVTGNSAAIRRYLTTNCENHPLVIGVLGGLVNSYLPDRGNFDAWVSDATAGSALNLASLDLTQRRNHILQAALADLPPKSGQLLSTLALLTESVDYTTLAAFNPHLPPEPKEVKKPVIPERDRRWKQASAPQRLNLRSQYKVAIRAWREYDEALRIRAASPEFAVAPTKLAESVTDLERRGLLQYDRRTKRHNIHPVVRGVTVGRMKAEEKVHYGEQVVDYFSALQHDPYSEAESINDLRGGLSIVRTLVKTGQLQRAADAYHSDLATALHVNVEAYFEALSLFQPFFPQGWDSTPKGLSTERSLYILNHVATSFCAIGEHKQALAVNGGLIRENCKLRNWEWLATDLVNVSDILLDDNRMESAFDICKIAVDLAECVDDGVRFAAYNTSFAILTTMGQWEEARRVWKVLNSMGRGWPREVCRPGSAEFRFARSEYWQGALNEGSLVMAEKLAMEGKNRFDVRHLRNLRGHWHLSRSEWAPAVACFHDALRMAREIGMPDANSETALVLAKHYLDQINNAAAEADRLSAVRHPADRLLAELWLALGNRSAAERHAIVAYRRAMANGEPYVNRYELTKATLVLEKLGIAACSVSPRHDVPRRERFSWEASVIAAIAERRTIRAMRLK